MRIEAAWPRPADLTDTQLEQLGAGLPGFPVVVDGGLYVYARFDVDAARYAATYAAEMTALTGHADCGGRR